MTETAARWITWTGAAVLAASAVATVVLNVMAGDGVFVARVMAGLAGCL